MTALIPTLDQMLFLLLCMLVGYILNKLKLLPENAGTTISKLENYVFVPALVISSFRKNCTFENLSANWNLLVYCIFFMALSLAIAIPLGKVLADSPDVVGIYRYSLAVANYGFIGNALVIGLFDNEMLFRYLIFCLPANIFCYTLGMVWLTAGKEKFSPKMLLNPAIICVILGVILGLTQIPFPSFVDKAISACAGCFSPVAMILTGFIIGKFELKKLFSNKRIYLVTLIRVILMPLLFLIVSKLLRFPEDVQTIVLIFSAMPLGLGPIVFPAAYGGNEKPGASMAVISNLIGIFTVPLMISLVIR